eukprot:CAMPEP_0174380510 /NCGR_PEP_ID=MMETSP0811_2-20130205/123426_1 /TAXON_ID=73025 ORGANISM="Eutreptiella gymnastica-like, Strain CCMP1594" /NCGR_SAMPLE_ID=MMETSP0811_2 /ASSEMBLY_ACC=CAM_ASM_000667 /LENGTH=46 /DNA_ID= /DNA_START= /DNA_END= /DNA_ORIENTATION=
MAAWVQPAHLKPGNQREEACGTVYTTNQNLEHIRANMPTWASQALR